MRRTRLWWVLAFIFVWFLLVVAEGWRYIRPLAELFRLAYVSR